MLCDAASPFRKQKKRILSKVLFRQQIMFIRFYGNSKEFHFKKWASEYGAKHIEPVSVNDAHHMHFNKGFGMFEAANLKIVEKELWMKR